MRLGFGVAGIAPAREDIPARSDGKGADNYETAIQAPPDSRRPMTEQDAHTRPAQSAARPSGTSAIRGVVVFDSNDVPVAGATISVELLDPERDYFESFTGHEWSAHAADNGKFRVASLPDGLFEVRAAYGADRGVDRVHCDPNEPEDQIVEVRIGPTGSIAGRVVNRSGDAVSGAEVRPVEGNTGRGRVFTERRANSNRDGYFTLTDLPVAEWILMGFAEGYAESITPQYPIGTTDAVVRLNDGGSVSGIVVDAATGNGIGEVKVTLHGEKTRRRRSVTTGADGQFAFPGLPDGAIWLNIDHSELCLYERPPSIQIENGNSVDGLELKVGAGGTVQGRAFDAETGAPIHGVAICAQTLTSREVCTDANGEYELRNVSPGNALVRRRWIHGYLHGEERDDKTVTVSPGEETTGVDFAMQPCVFIRGRVVDEAGNPVDFARVSGHNVDNPNEGDTEGSRPDGSFVLRGYSRGAKVYVSAVKRGYARATLPQIDLNATEITGIELVLVAGSRIEGKVIDSAGRPVVNARVNPVARDPVEGVHVGEYVNRDEPGVFEFSGVPPGVYGFRISDATSSYEVDSDLEIVIRQGVDATGLQLVFDPPRVEPMIDGHVVDSAGKPIKQASVQAHSKTGSAHASDTTDENGHFVLAGFESGEYHLNVHHWDHSALSFDLIAPSRNMRLTMPGTAKITGHILDARTGQPIRSFAVAWGSVDASKEGRQRVSQTSVRSTTYSTDGTYTLDGVHMGLIEVSVRAEGYPGAATEVEVRNERQTVRNVDFRLTPLPPEAMDPEPVQ